MTGQDPLTVIDQLAPDDALTILQTLAQDDPKLAARAGEMAMARLGNVDWKEVANDLHADLELLEVEEVWDRAGPSRDGYVDTNEVADEMIRDALAP